MVFVSIEKDKDAMIQERKRRGYIAKCIEEEIRYLQDQESYALVLHRNFTQLQAQSEKNMYEIWNQLQNKLGEWVKWRAKRSKRSDCWALGRLG